MLSGFLYSIDASTMVLGTFFAISFGVLMFILSKTLFKENRGLTTLIAFCIALLSTWGLNRSNYDLSGLFSSIGIPENLLYTITPLLLLAVAVFASIKKNKTTQKKSFSFGRFLMIIGLVMIALGLTPLIYQKGFYIIGGIIIVVLGIFLSFKRKKKDNLSSNYDPYTAARRQQKANQKLIEKQKAWQEKQYNQEVRNRAGKINKIRNRKQQIQNQKDLEKQKQDNRWAEEQQKENKLRRKQQEKEQEEYEKQLKIKQKQDEKWAREQQIRAEKQRMKNLKEQKEIEEKDRKRILEQQQKELQKQQEKQERMQKLRQRSINDLKMLYNEKYQEAIKQQNFIAKGVPGAREKYIRLQREIQNIVDKINKLSR